MDPLQKSVSLQSQDYWLDPCLYKVTGGQTKKEVDDFLTLLRAGKPDDNDAANECQKVDRFLPTKFFSESLV
jgi:hypothetical protein